MKIETPTEIDIPREIEITFLGTGTSQGIPVIACDCAVCHSNDARDRRRRTSALVRVNGASILIDAAPELRLQCLDNDVRRVDAVLVTHTHADHIFGLDDLRRFCQLTGKAIEVYAIGRHIEALEKVFGYARADRAGHNHDLPQFIFRTVTGPFELLGCAIQPLQFPHGRGISTGYRLGKLAYCTDISDVPDEAFVQLDGVHTLILGTLRSKPHPAHLSIGRAIEVARRVGAARTWLIHMSHHVSHADEDKLLPKDIRFAYDGLKVTCPA